MLLTEETKNKLKRLLQNATDKLYLNDLNLMSRTGLERSVQFRLGLYLHDELSSTDEFKDLDLDVEYTKNGQGSKILDSKPNGAQPDIILHKREHENPTNENNYLVIELKGWWDGRSREDDVTKLTQFVIKEGVYKFALGALIELGTTTAEISYYE